MTVAAFRSTRHVLVKNDLAVAAVTVAVVAAAEAVAVAVEAVAVAVVVAAVAVDAIVGNQLTLT
jgi:hypothetical protein